MVVVRGVRVRVRAGISAVRVDGTGRWHLRLQQQQLLLMLMLLRALLGSQPEVSKLDVAFGVEEYIRGLSKARQSNAVGSG